MGIISLGAAAIVGIYTAVMLISFSYLMLLGYDVNEQGEVDTTGNTMGLVRDMRTGSKTVNI